MKKFIKSGICIVLAGVLLVSILLGKNIGIVEASSRMLGVQLVVDKMSMNDPFTILEIVPDQKCASFGYYVSGMEPEIAPELLAGYESKEERKAAVITLLSGIAATDASKPLTYSEETVYQEQSEEPEDLTGWSMLEKSGTGEKIYYKVALENNDWFSAHVLEIEDSEDIEVITLTAADASAQIDLGILNLENVDLLYMSATGVLNVNSVSTGSNIYQENSYNDTNDITSNTELKLYQYATVDKKPVILDAALMNLNGTTRIEKLGDRLKEQCKDSSKTNGVCGNIFFHEEVVGPSLLEVIENDQEAYGYSNVLKQVQNENSYNQKHSHEAVSEYKNGDYTITTATMMKYALNYLNQRVITEEEDVQTEDTTREETTEDKTTDSGTTTTYNREMKDPEVFILEELKDKNSKVDKIYRTYDEVMESYSTDDETINYYVKDANTYSSKKTITVKVYYEVSSAGSSTITYTDSAKQKHYLAALGSAKTYSGNEASGSISISHELINKILESKNEMTVYVAAQTVVDSGLETQGTSDWVYEVVTINKLTLFELD